MSCSPVPEEEIMKAASKKVADMTLVQRQAHYSTLVKKIADRVILTKEELAELILLKDTLQT